MSARVLHVVRSLRRETGGLAEAVRNLAAAQRRRGDAASIVSLDPADASLPDVRVLGRHSHGYGYSPELVPWLRAHAVEFDVVVVHGLWQYQTFGVWRALRGGPVPYVVFPHGMLDVWFKRAHPLKHAKKWLYWPWSEYRVLCDAAAVCFTAEEERRRARQSFWLYRANERIAPIGIQAPDGVPAAERAAFAAACPELGGEPFILFLGRVHPKKGVDILLRAYAAAYRGRPGAPRLAIAGPSPDDRYRAELKALAASLAIAAAVTWLPMITGDVKWGALRSCATFALFSHQENFGVAVAEALACGRPVLLSDQIAICREIEMDGAGFVASDTVAGAVEALARWRDCPAANRAVMAACAEDCFRQRYEINQAAAAFDALIAEIRVRR